MPRKPTLPRKSGRPPKHGARLMQRILDDHQLDGRTKLARIRRDLRNEIADDAGGWDHLTARERAIVERVVAHILICGAIEDYAFAEGPIEDGELRPILAREYSQFAGGLTRMLSTLGLRPERPERRVDLADYVASQSSAESAADATDTDAPTAPTSSPTGDAAAPQTAVRAEQLEDDDGDGTDDDEQ